MSHQVPGNTGATDRGVETRCTDGALGEPSATERGTERPRDANVAAHADASGSFTNDQRLGDPLRADAADCSQVLRVRSRLPPSLDGGIACAAAAYDAHGNRPIYLPQAWPLARPQHATRESRFQCAELRIGFASAIQQEQHQRGLTIIPPCSWCGLPTRGYCDFCGKPIANPVCPACGGTRADIVATCRQCHHCHMSPMPTPRCPRHDAKD